MVFKNAQQQETTPMFTLGGQIDLTLRRLKKRSIFMVGKSRSGKSTLFNYTNQVELIGVPPEGANEFDPFGMSNAMIDVIYAPRIVSSQTAQANNGMKSVTLLPNISDRVDFTLVDMPGYLDQRRYNAVVGVSWVAKAAFEFVEECQFVLVLKFDYFRNGSQLFRAFIGFMNMFHFDLMPEQTKQKILESVTLVVTKSPKNVQIDPYISIMKNFLNQGKDSNYGDSQTVQKIAYVMEYFTNHPEQFFLFKSAQINEIAPECTIVKDHFQKRPYFEMKQQNQQFLQNNKKPIFRFPFAQDYQNMQNPNDKVIMKTEIETRIKSFKKFAKILQSFFLKAIDVKNLFKTSLSFMQQFESMKIFNFQNDIYSKQFDEKIQTGLNSIFSIGDPEKPLKVGINLAQNVFQLYKLFSIWPEYDNQEDPSSLEIFMQNFKEHLITIMNLFRNSFCTKWQQEQIITKFLFIAVRGCRQFSILYSFQRQGKHDMCQQLKDSFQAILTTKSLKKIQQQFILQLHAQFANVINRISQDKQQIMQYVNYLKKIQNEDQEAEISMTSQYKELLQKFIYQGSLLSSTPEQCLLSTFQNLIQHQKKVEDIIKKLDDEEGNYPDELNFTFLHLLSKIGSILLSLQRPDNLEEDNFAYSRPEDILRMKGKCSIKQYLTIEKAQYAMNIFSYVGDVQSVLECYELILKSTPENDETNRLKYMKGMAGFCQKHGRIEQAIIIYQKILKLCTAANLEKQYYQIKEILGMIPLQKQDRLKSYFDDLKFKRFIDPADDRDLYEIIDDIERVFIVPYERKLEELKENPSYN